MLELLTWRERNAKREIKVLGVLYFIHSVVWKALFGKQADSLEKSTENEDECKEDCLCRESQKYAYLNVIARYDFRQ